MMPKFRLTASNLAGPQNQASSTSTSGRRIALVTNIDSISTAWTGSGSMTPARSSSAFQLADHAAAISWTAPRIESPTT